LLTEIPSPSIEPVGQECDWSAHDAAQMQSKLAHTSGQLAAGTVHAASIPRKSIESLVGLVPPSPVELLVAELVEVPPPPPADEL
jgi:hypothetical protein